MALRILEIFGRGEERRVVALFFQHAEKMLEMNTVFRKSAALMIEREYEDLEKCVKQIREMEQEADRLKRKIEAKLYEGAFLPETRRQLYMVARSIDEVANMIQDSVESFSYMKRVRIPKPYISLFKRMVTYSSESVLSLIDVLHAVFENKKGLSVYVMKVRETEHFVDEIKDEMCDFMFITAKLKPIDLILIKKLTNTVDTISDTAKLCVDHIELLKIMKQA